MAGYYFALPDAHIFRASGADVIRYLNGRLTNDLRQLDESLAQLSAALTAKGRVQGLFTVLKLASNDYLALCDGGSADELTSAVLQFKVADQVELVIDQQFTSIIHVSEQSIVSAGIGLPGSFQLPEGELQVRSQEDFCCIRRDRGFGLGVDVVCAAEFGESLIEVLSGQGEQCASPALQRQRRLARGLPVYPDEINESLFFPEACMPEAISTTKGCYVGQEAVEMSSARGKLAGRLMRIEAEGDELSESGSSVALLDPEHSEPQVVGKVISGSAAEGASYYIARVKKLEHADGLPISVGSQSGRLFSL